MRNEKKKKIKKILIVSGLIAFVLALVFAGSEIIRRSRVTSFEVETNNLTCTGRDQIYEYLKGLNIHYFVFKQTELEQNLKKQFLCIGKIETRLSYPDKLILKSWGREALFTVRKASTSSELNPVVNLPDVSNEASESTKESETVRILDRILSNIKESSDSGVYLVDRDGIVFEKNTGSINLPIVLILGKKIDIGVEIPDGIIEKTSIIYNKLKEIEVYPGNIIIIGDRLVVDSKPRITFSLKKNIDYQTASLQLILAQAKMNSDPLVQGSDDVESIDLRFNKPVVVYVKK